MDLKLAQHAARVIQELHKNPGPFHIDIELIEFEHFARHSLAQSLKQRAQSFLLKQVVAQVDFFKAYRLLDTFGDLNQSQVTERSFTDAESLKREIRTQGCSQ